MIPPGGEGKIKVTLHPKGKATKISKTVVVHSDDPEQPQFSLTLKGKLLVDITSSPTTVRIPDLKVGESGSGTFKLQLSDGTKAEIESVVLEDSERFALRRTDEGEGLDGNYEVTFRGRPDIGATQTRVRVTTTGENTPELLIAVRATTAKNLRYLKSLRFSQKGGEVQDRKVHISARHGDAPKIGKIEDPSGLLDIKVGETRGPMVTLEVKIDQAKWDQLDKAAQKEKREFVVHTNDAEEPKLTFEFRVLPRSKARKRPRKDGLIEAKRMDPN